VAEVGPWIESHPRFPARVNVGFMQVLDRQRIQLRVFERGAGETLACGTGACAAVAAGIRLGWLDARVDVHTHGGRLTIAWDGPHASQATVRMAGPADTVFEGEIDL
jgi:diaminopimelate epimerase